MKNTSIYVAISITVIEQLKKDNIKNSNVVEFIKDISKVIKKLPSTSKNDGIKALILNLTEIGKGSDGLMGTSDDLLDEKIITDLKMLSETSMLEDLVQLFTKPKLSYTQKMLMFVKHCSICIKKN